MTEDTSIADECEAFLHGRLVELRLARDEGVPPWAWFNKLAHATGDELLRIADGTEMAYGTGDGLAAWNQVAAVLAGELVERADHMGVDVRALQDGRLLPFELAAAQNRAGYPLTPSLLLSLTRALLGGHPSVQALFL